MTSENKKIIVTAVIISVICGSIFGSAMGFWAGTFAGAHPLANIIKNSLWRGGRQKTGNQTPVSDKVIATVDQESAVVSAVEKVSPAVVSIIVSKDLPIMEQYFSNPSSGSDFFQQFFGNDFNFQIPQYRQKGTQKQEIGGGSGFLVSADGYIITNQHVVSDQAAEYTVLMNDESKHEAKVLARDPVNDIAILKIEGKNFPTLELGDSTNLKVGQTVIAIGNALGEFRNTVSTGVISGLSRSVVAGSGFGGDSEQLSGVIQTDASINPGNSGGPLLNISGQVIGMNTAMAAGAENIGFTIPINEIKNVYESVLKNGRIIRPWIGVRYVMIDSALKDKNKLPVDNGALIVRGEDQTDLAVIPGSPADKAGLVENDIILEVNGKKIDEKNILANTISKLAPGDQITLKVMHRGETKDVKVKLEEMK